MNIGTFPTQNLADMTCQRCLKLSKIMQMKKMLARRSRMSAIHREPLWPSQGFQKSASQTSTYLSSSLLLPASLAAPNPKCRLVMSTTGRSNWLLISLESNRCLVRGGKKMSKTYATYWGQVSLALGFGVLSKKKLMTTKR